MKKLLTGKEMVANCRNVYNADYSAFTVEGEPRGEMKQSALTPMEIEAFYLMKFGFKQMGLEDYIEMEYDEESKTAFVRCIIEDEAAEN